jgi:putative SOS response-associated peptidase YedK
MTDDSVFAFAGIWDRWKSPDKGWLETCSVVTTSANGLLSDIHDRMPVILKSDNYDLWLDPGFHATTELLDVLKPFPAGAMRGHSVSTRVNSVQNDDAACAEEFAPNLLF